jgi:hypothetical protein
VSSTIVRYPTWKEIFGARPTEAELLNEIRELDRVHTISLLAQINLLLALDRFHANEQSTIELQTFLVNLLIDEDLFTLLKTKFGNEKLAYLRPFHSLQVLTLMKRVVLNSPDIGGLQPGTDNRANTRLGRCLMMTNDFLVSQENISAIRPERPRNKRKLALQLQFGSSQEISNPPEIYVSVVRSDMIFGNLVKSVPGTLNVREAFEQSSGMTLEEYVDHILGLLTYYITLDFRKLTEDPGLSYIAIRKIFAESRSALVERFWQRELVTMEGLQASLREPTGLKPHLDFIALRKKPFLEVAQDSAIALHLGFVQEKLESGLFWAIFNSLNTREEKYSMFTYWGHLFEQYVSQLFAKSLKGSSTNFVSFSQFCDNDEEAFDGVASDGKYLIVMEYKGGFLSAKAKYAEDEDEFVRDLDRKFGSGKGAGLEQLVRKIAAVFAENPAKRRPIKGLDTSAVKVVVPVLVVQESFVSSEITASCLADSFGSLKRKERLDSSVVYTFPLVMDVSDVEFLRPFLAATKVSLVDCLMERVRMGSGGFLSFRDFFRQYRQERNIKTLPDDETFEHFKRIMDRISLRFFNKPLESRS